MNEFFKLTEHNEWEGETWHFFIPVKDNIGAWFTLRDKYSEFDGENRYVFDPKTYPENEIDILVKHSDSGYMNVYNKIVGVLDKKKIDDINFSDDNDDLYKGGIANLMIKD